MHNRLKNIRWGIILVVVGLIFLLHNYGVIHIGTIIVKLWPLLLIWWGYTIIRQGRRHRDRAGHFEAFGDRIITSSSPEIYHSSVFGDIRIKVDSKEFSGGSANNVFGKLFIDLGSVEKITGDGRLDLKSVFGEIMIHLPDGVAFDVSGSSAFGSVISPDGTKLHGSPFRSSDFETAEEKLTIHVSHIFGDIEMIR
ncbi:MAG: hypothetical protein KAX38_06055 [Candidatus Krumholzibacteria bacterium]|nr:hypothetical protein [Candidatus Krumholzibacteria bacterium]